MGIRGPLRMPNSRRGERERRRNTGKSAPEPFTRPELPKWLPEPAAPFWNQLVENLEAAKVPLERCDSEALAMYALAVYETQKAAHLAEGATTDVLRLKFMSQSARFGRDALNWSSQLGATP